MSDHHVNASNGDGSGGGVAGYQNNGPGPSSQSGTTLMSSGSRTQTVTQAEEKVEQTAPVLHLKLKKPKNKKRVVWTEETVDNEGMNKRKSKCCCIYKKPQVFGESSDSGSDDSDDDCENCGGHKHHDHDNDNNDPSPSAPLS